MLNNNVIADELCNEALLARVGESSNSGASSSRNERPSIDARILLRRTSSDRGESATSYLSGPLLPTVRRLLSSPEHFGGGQHNEIKDQKQIKAGRIAEEEKPVSRASPSDIVPVPNEAIDRSDQGHSVASSSNVHGSSPSSANDLSSFAGKTFPGNLALLKTLSGKDAGGLPSTSEKASKVGSVKVNLKEKPRSAEEPVLQRVHSDKDSAQEARSAWKPKLSIQTDSIDQLPARPTKGQRTGGAGPGQRRLINGFMGSGNYTKRDGGTEIGSPKEVISVDKKEVSPRPEVGSPQVRKRRPAGVVPDPKEDVVEGRQVADSSADEARRKPCTASSSRRVAAVGRQDSGFSLASFIRHRTQFSSFAIFLLLLMSILSMLYAVALNDQIIFLEKKLVKLQGKVRGCSTGDIPHRLKDRSNTEADEEQYDMDWSEKAVRKFALLVSIFVLSSPFLIFKYVDEIPRLSTNPRSAEEEVPLSKRLAYRIDVLFSTIPLFKPLALLLATILLIAIGGVALFSVSSETFGDAMWRAWTYVADAGNHADSVGTGPRIVSISISFGGMLIFALMLGLVSDAISEKVDSLRKGKSEVIESNHTLILGWSDKLGSLLKQLAIANQSLGGGVVVVLAERDKEEMELDIAKMEFDFMGTAVICRSGSPLIMADLKKVSVSKARAIIVLAEAENADQSDARVLRVVLSLTGVREGLRGHIVVELSDLDNEQLVKLVGGDMVETVVAHDVIGRLMIQCARQPGLAQIWEDILGFDNAEFYVKRWPQLDGMRFDEVFISFPDAIPCGVKVASNHGQIVLNPNDDYVLSEGDELLVIAEDDDTYTPGPVPKIRKGSLPKVFSPPKLPEKILFCGWRRDIDDMVQVLEAFLPMGSELWMFSEVPILEREKKLMDGGLNPHLLVNVKLVHREGNAVIRRHLESLPLETFDSILILADEALEDSVVNADSRSLATLLLIRDIQSKRMPYRETTKPAPVRQAGSASSSGPSASQWIREMQQASDQSIIISEILDSRTKNLVSVSKISDYVLSNELVSMALAMVAEDKQINRVLEELFAEEGNEMYIRPGEMYLYDQEELSFNDIMFRARQRREIVIGYRLASAERAIINPPNKAVPQKWSLGDVFIVLAQEE